MSKEKFDEITELSDDIYNSFQHIARSDGRNLAESLYNDGWRKQREAEWISVDERLPEESGSYITYHDHGNCGVIYYNASIHLWNVYYHEDKQNAIRSVTHWMPLPEPSDMKGGSE